MGLTIGYATEYIDEQIKSNNSLKEHEGITGIIGGSGLMLSFLGSLAGGFIMDTFGRKRLFYVIYFLSFVGWITVAATKYFLIGRLLTSISIGTGFSSSVYTTEILQPNLRGSFCLLGCVFEVAGNEFVYVLQYYFSSQWAAYALSAIALLLFGATHFIPESPYWSLMKGRKADAFAALRWLREGDELVITSELEQMQENFGDKTYNAHFREVISNREAWKLFGKLSIYVLLIESTGFDMIIPYSVQFFNEINRTGVDNRVLTMTFAAVGIVGTIILMFFVEKFERIKCVTVANLVNVVCLSVVALRETFFQSPSYSIVSVVSMMAYSPLISFSCFIFPWIIISESLPTDMRGIIFAALSAEFFIIFYAIVQTFPYILYHVSVNIIIFSFIVCSVLNIIFVNVYMTETRGGYTLHVSAQTSSSVRTPLLLMTSFCRLTSLLSCTSK